MSQPLPVPAESARQHRILELDGMRAFSVILVIIYHSWRYSGTVKLPDSMGWFIEPIGLIGVKTFFTISGFIITRLMLEEVAATGRFSTKVFFIKRAFRILPAYWVYLCVATWLIVGNVIMGDPINMVAGLVFGSDMIQWGSSYFYGHIWSLSVEEQYYVLFPLLVFMLRGKGVKFTSIVLTVIYVLIVFAPNVSKYTKPYFFNIDIASMSFFGYIIDGALLAIWWDQFGNFARRFTNWLVPISLTIILLCFPWVLDTFPREGFYLKYPWMMSEPLLIAAIMGWILHHPEYFALLRWEPIQWLGRISYSVYLWQQLFTGYPRLYLKVPTPNLIEAVLGILLCATFSYYFIERPFNAMGRRILKRRAKEANAANAPEPASPVS